VVFRYGYRVDEDGDEIAELENSKDVRHLVLIAFRSYFNMAGYIYTNI